MSLYRFLRTRPAVGRWSLLRSISMARAMGQAGKVVTKDGRTLTAEEAGARVTFYVKTEPHDLEPVFHAEAANPFKIEKAGQLAGGIWKYTVTAPDITGNTEYFDNFNTTYTFTVTHVETGRSASGKLSLLQKEYNAIPF